MEEDWPTTSEQVGCALQVHTVTDSTNMRAREWAEGAPHPAPHGAIVLADEQTAGRGRLGRAWVSSPGQNLLFTLILRPRPETVARGMLPLATALAIADTINQFLGMPSAEIKWPNDVLIGGRKCAGVLMEAISDKAVLIGIGLNVNEAAFPEALQNRSTSLLLESGQRMDRRALFSGLTTRLQEWIYQSDEHVLASYQARVSGIGDPIELSYGQKTIRGMMSGIHSDGGLILKTDKGENVYYAGDVTLLKPKEN